MTVAELITNYADEIAFINASGYSGMDESALAVQVAKAYEAIRNYLFLPKDKDLSDYFNAACELAVAYYIGGINLQRKLSGERNTTQRTQGSRSETLSSADVTLDSHGLTETVKGMLPLPFLRVL